MKNKYNLSFISDEQIYEHVKNTVERYSDVIDLNKFNSNLIDPIKLTFDAKVYGKSFEEIIEAECLRQIDKSNTNHIGYFHQNLFNYAPKGWYVPEKVFDVANDEHHIYVEMKNKHNTMNSSSGKATYIKFQDKLLKDKKATCMLVEVLSARSQNIVWSTSIDGQKVSNERIRRVSMDKFYEIVFGKHDAFMSLCKQLPLILDDVIKDTTLSLKNTVLEELKKVSQDTFKSLFILAFSTYDGIDKFKNE